MLKNRKGFILIAAYLVIAVLIILGAAFISRSISEMRIAEKEKDSIQAFYLAEAGIERAIQELRGDYNWGGVTGVALGNGEYSVSIAQIGDERRATVTGFIPNSTAFRVRRVLEANIRKYTPPNFYDNALYVAQEVDFKGNAYSVNGDILYGQGPISNTNNVTGTVTQDPSADPFPRLDFSQLYSMSQSQGNVYDDARLDDVKKGDDSFPNSFWFDEANNVPNIVYVESDLELKGNVGTVCGFFVVVGDVLTNPSGTYDATINGNGQIEGCIYTTGEFKVNGGGGGLNVNGGIWTNEELELNGNATITYNQTYMDAIKTLNINPDVQIISWREVY